MQRVGAPFDVTVIAVLLQHFAAGATTIEDALTAFTWTFWWVFGLTIIPLVLAPFLPGRRWAAGAAP